MKLGYIALILALGIGLTSLTGCSGLGVKTELYRIDERQESQSTKMVPFRCLFVNCEEGVKHES